MDFWHWTITDPMTGRRRRLRYRMIEEDARARFGDDAVKVEGSREVRQPGASAAHVQRPPKK